MERDKRLIIIEAEYFKDHGGWAVDSQFIDIMDSPYLPPGHINSPTANLFPQAFLGGNMAG